MSSEAVRAAVEAGNLFSGLDTARESGEELFEPLLRAVPGATNLRVLRIVSTGQSAPEGGGWFDQDDDEFVVLLKGAARLQIEDEVGPRRLVPGDHLLLPAHVRHRVDWTDPDTETVWLAVHFSRQGGNE